MDFIVDNWMAFLWPWLYSFDFTVFELSSKIAQALQTGIWLYFVILLAVSVWRQFDRITDYVDDYIERVRADIALVQKLPPGTPRATGFSEEELLAKAMRVETSAQRLSLGLQGLDSTQLLCSLLGRREISLWPALGFWVFALVFPVVYGMLFIAIHAWIYLCECISILTRDTRESMRKLKRVFETKVTLPPTLVKNESDSPQTPVEDLTPPAVTVHMFVNEDYTRVAQLPSTMGRGALVLDQDIQIYATPISTHRLTKSFSTLNQPPSYLHTHLPSHVAQYYTIDRKGIEICVHLHRCASTSWIFESSFEFEFKDAAGQVCSIDRYEEQVAHMLRAQAADTSTGGHPVNLALYLASQALAGMLHNHVSITQLGAP